MKRLLRKLSALALTLAAALVSFNISASAENTVNGGASHFDCYLIVDESKEIPGITFEYSYSSAVKKTLDKRASLW